jgi:hypothetical protein
MNRGGHKLYRRESYYRAPYSNAGSDSDPRLLEIVSWFGRT